MLGDGTEDTAGRKARIFIRRREERLKIWTVGIQPNGNGNVAEGC
jgi:hypothetical protein